MKIFGIDHIAINTINIDESIAFYQNALKLEVTKKVDLEELILVYIEVDEKTTIELFDLKGKCIEGKVSEEQQGLRHIAFRVENIEEWNKHLKQMNAEFVVELCRFEQINNNVLLIKDPNGVVIELCEDIKK